MSQENTQLSAITHIPIHEKARNIRFDFYVKNEFFVKNSPDVTVENVSTIDLYTLLDRYKMGTFLHNEKKPSLAVTLLDQKGNDLRVFHEEFWINGNRVTDMAVIEKMKYGAKFSDNVKKLIND